MAFGLRGLSHVISTGCTSSTDAIAYAAQHIALGRRYALKVLRTKVIERDAGAAQKFLREARTAARVRHPNIVDVVDFGHLAQHGARIQALDEERSQLWVGVEQAGGAMAIP